MNDQLSPDGGSDDHRNTNPPSVSDATAWSMIATLVAGRATWGGIGWAVDRLLGTGRTCTLIGVVVGFVTSIYVVYVRYGRLSDGAGDDR